MKFYCNACNKEFGSEEALQQHNNSKHPIAIKRKMPVRKYLIISLIVLAVFFFAASAYSYMKKPGNYDEFAKCLSEKGAIVYGNDFCQYTAKQLNYFGKSKQYLNYVKCSENKELCDQKGIKTTPTWEINGNMYQQIQTFKRLSEITGCNL